MEAVGKLLPAIFKRQMRRDETRVVEFLIPLWPRAAGRGIAENSIPVHFGAGTLTLETTCPTWAIQLRGMTEEIRAGINNVLGVPIVKAIRVQIAPRLGQREAERILERPREAETLQTAVAQAAIAKNRALAGAKTKAPLRAPGRAN